MATYPVKLLHDENNQPFIPFTCIDVIYNKYNSTAALPTPAREGNVATVQDGTDYNLYIYYNGAWAPLTQEGPRGPQGPQGIQGVQGIQGEPFTIKKTYATTAAMTADYDNMAVNDFVMISGSVEDPDNAKMFVKGTTEDPTYRWNFVTDFSGATGIQGPQGVQGVQGVQGPAGDSGVYIGTTTPSGSQNVWIDTSGTTDILKISNGSTWTTIPSVTGADGRDGAIQYTTGNGIAINSSNVISADVDNAPVSGSNKLLSSGAIYTALSGKQDTITFNTAYSASTNKAATMSDVPTKVSQLQNDSGFITSYTETDPIFTASAAHGITSANINTWNGKQDAITFNSTYSASTNPAATMADVPTMLSGTTEPTSGQGKNGDLYILTD